MKTYEGLSDTAEVQAARETMRRAGYWFEAGDFRFRGKSLTEWEVLERELDDIHAHSSRHGAYCETDPCTCGKVFLEELHAKHHPEEARNLKFRNPSPSALRVQQIYSSDTERRNAIRERLLAATQGQWQIEPNPGGQTFNVVVTAWPPHAGQTMIARDLSLANACFIRFAAEDLDWLLRQLQGGLGCATA